MILILSTWNWSGVWELIRKILKVIYLMNLIESLKKHGGGIGVLVV